MTRKSLPSTRRAIPKRNAKRRKSEFARCYGSKERVEFVKSLPCLTCGWVPSENAHIKGDGAGRKAHYTEVVPLCGYTYMEGCHQMLHRMGRGGFDGFEMHFRIDLEKAAAETHAAWIAFSGATK
jgi:hypothetical protein